MSEALRSVFAEFGFKVDKGALDALDARVKTSAKKMEALQKAASGPTSPSGRMQLNVAEIKQQMAVAKNQASLVAWDEKRLADAKAHKEAIEAQSEALEKQKAKQEELTKKLSTYSGIVEHVSTKLHTAFGQQLLTRFPKLGAMAQRAGLNAEGMGKAIAGASVVIIGVLHRAATAALEFATAFAADAEALRDTARESRVTTTQLQELDHAAVAGGVGLERMRSGLSTFGQGLRNAERWGNGTTGTLRRLGIQARDASGHIRPTSDLLDEVAIAMEHVESPTRRARIATQLFGEAGRRMLDILHTGPGGIRALRQEMAELGGGVTPEAVAASRQFTVATEKSQRAMDSLRSVLAVALLPALAWVATNLAHAAGLLARLTAGTHVAQIALVALGVAGVAAASTMIVAWFPLIATTLFWTAVIGLAALALDDLIVTVEGGDSVIRQFVDSMWGVGTTESVVRGLRDMWQQTSDAITSAVEAVRSFGESSEETQIRHEEEARRRQSEATSRALASLAPGEGFVGADHPTRGGKRTVTVPATRSVAAPGTVASARTVVRQTSHQNHNVFQLAGPDAHQLAAKVGEILDQQAKDQRDGDHPTPQDDGGES